MEKERKKKKAQRRIYLNLKPLFKYKKPTDGGHKLEAGAGAWLKVDTGPGGEGAFLSVRLSVCLSRPETLSQT